MREKFSLPKSTSYYIMNEMMTLFADFHGAVITAHSSSVSAEEQYVYLNDGQYLLKLWEKIRNVKEFSKYCTSIGLVEPVQIDICHKKSFFYVPVLKTLIKLLESPGIWEEMMSNALASHEEDLLVDFTSGDFFKNHSYFHGNRQQLRLHLYCDELEVCNPIGSSRKKNKLTCYYLTVGNVGQKNLSSLQNIYLCLIAPSCLVSDVGHHDILQPLLKDIYVLETSGISFKVAGNSEKNSSSWFNCNIGC